MFFLQLLLLVALTSAEMGPALVDRCCTLGSRWSEETEGECAPYPQVSMWSVDRRDRDTCGSLANICCIQTYRHKQCMSGRDIALYNASCSSITVVNGNMELYTHQKECCECCDLGTQAARFGESCDLFQHSGGICDKSAECCDAFFSCCNMSSSLAATTPATTPTTTTTVSPDVPPTHIVGGICDKFSSALCEHYCHDALDRPNKFRCSCRSGFELAANNRNCIESAVQATCDNANRCGLNAKCYMRLGVPTCRCVSDGYRLVGAVRCEDIDECSNGLDNCASHERCTNTAGGYECTDTRCPHGQVFDVSAGKCLSNGRERPVVPVSCRTGYIFDYTARSCVSARPSGSRCPSGYAVNIRTNSCEDVDECATGTDDCDATQRCENIPGTFRCRRRISCGTGYSLQGPSQSCVDINECAVGTHNCGPAFTCTNIPGSFKCEYKICPSGLRLNITTGACLGADQCNKGFVWAELTRRCEDVNECLYENPCLPAESCINTPGSYKCVGSNKVVCYNGFELNSRRNVCEDINECERGIHNCLSRSHCTNTRGSFRCRCDAGYSLNSVTNTCQDINECSRSVGQYCSPTNSECVNTPGSFYCKCKDGFESIANGKGCQDTDECLTPNICQHTCHNIWGSFQCRCRPGYRLAGDKRSCVDENECELMSTRGRLCNGFCENTPGSFRCACPGGFKLSNNGRECIDVDECAEGIAGCSGANAVCVNTRGSFHCQVVECPKYFAPADSASRTSVRCARQTFVCSQGDVECLTAPLSLSYNYLTLRASRIRVPTELFTMRGPDTFPRIDFEFDVKSVQSLGRDAIAVTRDHFRLFVDPERPNVAIVSVVLPIEGKQDIELKLDMNIYNDNGFFGTASATITIYATVDPWETS